ncbi:hypothetical protein QGM71_07150 [Virgibacillus sp. C22-A2]|uniref:Uncharacterized protein n=1 Tax=Virgibacillus tibetensis TaxID=3042313 RepID=A0ABU6KD57_9BACI|nr:hypothetical protein [Virgibacillus sp. C22-A2]
MGWIADVWLLLLVGGLPTVLSILLGVYWLKHERFPWEKSDDSSTMYEEDQEISK